MRKTEPTPGMVGNAARVLAWSLTSTAALFALLVNAKNLGLTQWFGVVDTGFAEHAAARVMVTPRSDSLFAIGDTTILAAAVTDRRGAVLSGPLIHWRSEDTTVAVVDTGGVVEARGQGQTRVLARVRDLTASTLITVVQRPTRVMITGDTALKIRQGDTVQLAVVALDARGHRIAQVSPIWKASDSSVVSVDALGTAIGKAPGEARVRVRLGEGEADVGVTVELTASALAVLTGQGQRAPAGRSLPEPVVFRAVSRSGRPVPGATVILSAADGNGQAEPDSGTTDRDGRFRAGWILGQHPGPQRLLARLTNLDTSLVVEAEADPVPGDTRVELIGTAPSGLVAKPLGQELTLRFSDTLGVALVNVPVNWKLLDGGRVEGASRTDSAGTASARWTLGSRAGKQRLLVQVGNPRAIPPYTVTAEAIAGPPTWLRVVGGQGQRGVAGTRLPKPVVAVVRDGSGNPVPEFAVTVRTLGPGGKDTILATDGRGRASFRWTLGPTAGEQAAEIRVAGIDSTVRVTATARPGPPSTVELTPAATKSTGSRVKLVAAVSDANGNWVPGASVVFSASSGRLSASRVASDTGGKALVSWTPSTTAREPGRVKATIAGTRVSATYTMPGTVAVKRN